MTFFAVQAVDPAPTAVTMDVLAPPVVERRADGPRRLLRVSVNQPYAESLEAVLRVTGVDPSPLPLSFGTHRVELQVPSADSPVDFKVALEAGGQTLASREFVLPPVPPMVLHLLPHSHVDIGYTALQPEVLRKQIDNIARGIALARATEQYPPGARYRWNVEVLWAVDGYLREATPQRRQEFVEAVRRGWVGLDALYGNVLTGLCRPEELLRLFRYAAELAELCGTPVRSAMISDVPGYTWGTVSAMAQANVRYWSIGPNYGDRIGRTLTAWENRPFWWVGPSGQDRVLCLVPYQGYAVALRLRSTLTDAFVLDLMAHLTKTGYPWEVAHLRWSLGDNSPPDESIPDFVRGWNERYERPELRISTTAEAFADLEARHGAAIPAFRGDWTPYWEDGAGSSALETAVNRASAERLVQAETLWAILRPGPFPAQRFHDAWREVLLYSEHTWGAHNSITEPESPFVQEQWRIKQAFALNGRALSEQLLREALEPPGARPEPASVAVYNTTGWTRTDLAIVPPPLSTAGDAVIDEQGRPVPSQRLRDGTLAVLAGRVPAMGRRVFRLAAGNAWAPQPVRVAEDRLDNGLVSVRLDPATGAIVELKSCGHDANFADARAGALNEYLFVAGDDAAHPQRAGPVTVRTGEAGPLVASLIAESEAPGCHRLIREVRVIAGLDRVEIINVVDKRRADVQARPGDWLHASRESKESLHFGFAFDVPGGVVRMDVPWAVVRPEEDQLPGANRNWFTVQRWVDVSNDDRGATWATLDAPLVEIGGLTANLLGPQRDSPAWIERLEPSQTIYSWVMNNHWYTNYRAWQEGPVVFRYAIRPHGGYAPIEAARFGVGLSQPLITGPAVGGPAEEAGLVVEPDEVLVTAFKPGDDGRSRILRLFGAGGKAVRASVRWPDPQPASVWISDLSEKPVREVSGPVEVPGWGIVTLRAEHP